MTEDLPFYLTVGIPLLVALAILAWGIYRGDR